MSVSPTGLAYAAGCIDCDGCISVTYKKARDKYEVNVQFVSKNPTMPNWFSERFGGYSYQYRQGPQAYKLTEYYRWSVWGKRAQQFLEQIMPFLKEKRRQAELACRCPVGSTGIALTHIEKDLQANIREQVRELNSQKGKRH